MTKVASISARFSKSLARRRFRPNREKVRSINNTMPSKAQMLAVASNSIMGQLARMPTRAYLCRMVAFDQGEIGSRLIGVSQREHVLV